MLFAVGAGVVAVGVLYYFLFGSNTRILYHYTDETGARGILQSGKLRPSTGQGDAAFGYGVYLTSKNPRGHSMMQIAENNYDGAWQSHVSAGRTKVAFQFKIPLTKLKEANSNRDVWLYTDGYLNLNEYGTGAIMKGTATGGYDWYLQ